MSDEYKIENGRCIRVADGMVAVVVSPDFGASWSCEDDDIDPMQPDIAFAVAVGGERAGITKAKEIYGEWPTTMEINWVMPGTVFYIHEYDGSECVMTINDIEWLTA